MIFQDLQPLNRLQILFSSDVPERTHGIQQHLVQKQYPPSIDTASPYTGTLEDPIPYEHWMIIDKDLYQIENDILYQDLLDAPNGYDADLSSLPSIAKKIE